LSAPAGLRFECTGCGRCCTNQVEYSHVYVNDRESKAMARLKGLSLREFEKLYTFTDEYGWTQLTLAENRCVFLGADDSCGVYAARPTQCRTFPFWREFVDVGEWTDEVRQLCEGVGQGRLYSIEEADVLMVAMEESDRDD